MLTKQAAIQLKVGPDDGLSEGQFTAYAAVFDNIDSYGDVVVKGAFESDLQRWADSGNPIPLLFGHNMSDPDFNLGSVLDAKEDDTGLLVTAELDLENPKARQVYRMLKGRRINQMSFAYDVIDGSQATRKTGDDESESFYELRELKLYEVSIVTVGANQETEILAVKQMPTVAERIVEEIKAGRVLSAKNESEIRTAHESLGRVLSAFDGTDNEEEKASDSGPSHQAPPADEPAGQPREASPAKSSVDPSALLDAIAAQISVEIAC